MKQNKYCAHVIERNRHVGPFFDRNMIIEPVEPRIRRRSKHSETPTASGYLGGTTFSERRITFNSDSMQYLLLDRGWI